ncbi:MAG: GreA/GreB family elongation factor [Mesorhizobium sp.]
MSKAFTNKDGEEFVSGVGERPVSTERNLVTVDGIAQMEAHVNRLRKEFAEAERKEEREAMAIATRDLRYWQTRRETAELSVPEPDETVIRFGMTVQLEAEDGKHVTWKIVGEDEAEPNAGKISHVSPMARAMFGKSVGDVFTLNDREWEVTKIEV